MKFFHFACLVVLVLTIQSACGQLARTSLDGTADVGVEDKSGNRLPLETKFTDSSGQQISLGSLFDGNRPVILTFNYADCPMLCKLQLTGLVDSLKHLEWTT